MILLQEVDFVSDMFTLVNEHLHDIHYWIRQDKVKREDFGCVNKQSYETSNTDSLFYQPDVQILYFNAFIAFLYMFRALLCSSSGEQLY